MKQIEKALDLAQCELRAAYKRLGYADSNVLKLVDEALNQVKNCNIHDVSNSVCEHEKLTRHLGEFYECDGCGAKIRMQTDC